MISALWGSLPPWGMIFGLSFLVALTGAMAPGPLLTYTIIQTARSKRRGYLMGVWVILGHAIIEMGILLVLLMGFAAFINHPWVVKAIGVVGGGLLLLFGFSILRDVRKGTIDTNFLESADLGTAETSTDTKAKSGKLQNPIIGGALVSMANPYWWVWWATIGLAFLVQYDIGLTSWPKLVAFFIGHEAGDLAWYLVVSVFVFVGLRKMNRRIYYSILGLCAVFMMLFGIVLGVKPFMA